MLSNVETWFVLFFVLLGLLIGSFLNVAVLRFGFRERASQRSRCMQCDTTLNPLELVPIVSFVFLKGRCRHCGSRLSWQYPTVELVNAVLFGMTAFMLGVPETIGQGLYFISFLGFWSSLVVLVAYDIRHTLIPMPFVHWLWAFAAIAQGSLIFTEPGMVPFSLLTTLCVTGFFAAISIGTKGKGMGIGDAFVAFGITLALGFPAGIVAAVVGVWSGALYGLCILGLQKVFPRGRLSLGTKRVTLKSELPFAPFLALGAIIAFCASGPIAAFFF